LVQQLLAAKQIGSLQLLAAVKAVENNLFNEISSWFVYVIAWELIARVRFVISRGEAEWNY